MNQEWKQFLSVQGAIFTDHRIDHFGTYDRERRLVCAGTVIAALTQHSILRITGADAKAFLSNQLSNDVNLVDNNQNQYTAWCTHQGKILATLVLSQKNDTYYALVASSLVTSMVARLEMFIMHADVQISLETSWVAMEIAGPKASEDLKKAGLPAPSECLAQTIHNEVLFSKSYGVAPRYLILGSQIKIQKIWQALDVHAAPVGENARNLLDIRAGIPHISIKNTEKFTPHMLNMQNIPMVNFQKGCYPGQEVVARMQYLGKNKRAMYHITIERSEAIPAGEKLLSKSSTSPKGAGQIVQTAHNGDNLIEGLAVLDQTAVDNHDLTDAQGNAVGFMELTY